jgi:hypothetical protein
MRIKALFVLLVAIILSFSGCSLFSNSSPTATFTAFFEAAKKKDVAAMKQHCSKASLEMMERIAKQRGQSLDEFMQSGISEAYEPTAVVPETRNEKITGDNATLESKLPNGEWDTLSFVKEDGKWKFAFDRMAPAPSEKPTGP